jgi:hypothetical protein
MPAYNLLFLKYFSVEEKKRYEFGVNLVTVIVNIAA